MKMPPWPAAKSRGAYSARTESSLHPGLKSLDRCLKRHWKRYRKALKSSKKDFSEESTHAYRIEARRLMAALELMLPFVSAKRVAKLEEDLKAHLDISDQLRDTQVQLVTLKGLRPAEPGLRAFAACLQDRERRLKKKTRRKIKNAKIGRIQKMLAAGRKELKQALELCSAEEAAKRLLESAGTLFARTKKLYVRIKPDETDTIHRTRVSFKKFRYFVEALAEIVCGLGCEYLQQLRAYQALMGNIQDRKVLIESFNEWVAEAKPEEQWALRVRARLDKGQKELIQTYLLRGDRLLAFWPLSPGHSLERAPEPALQADERRS